MMETSSDEEQMTGEVWQENYLDLLVRCQKPQIMHL